MTNRENPIHRIKSYLGSGSGSIITDADPQIRIRIRIQIKMIWIRNTAYLGTLLAKNLMEDILVFYLIIDYFKLRVLVKDDLGF